MPESFKILSDREHILTRPNMYIGAIDTEEQSDFILENDKIEFKNFKIIPGLCKIINEIIDNSIDEAIKTDFKFSNKINIKISKDCVEVSDNGRGIPIELHEHENEKRYRPFLAWGIAKSGSNFSDEERTQIGMNGVGSYLSNVFSKKFVGYTYSGGKSYEVTFKDNATKFVEKLGKASGSGTTVKFYPDLERFKISEIDETHISYIHQRIICLANIFEKIEFKFNNKIVRVKSFKDFAKMFGNCETYETENVKFALIPNSFDDFKQFSYVNGLKIKDGGTHIDTIMKNVVDRMREKLIKKYKSIKPGDIKNKLTLVCFLKNFENCKFNSQTKEKLTNSEGEFNKFSKIDYSFVDKILKNKAFTDPIVDLYKIKEEYENRKALKGLDKNTRIKSEKFYKGIGKSDYLFICEGESALGGIAKCIGNKGNDFYCLKGKPLNVFDVSHQKFSQNEELKTLYQIILKNDYKKICVASDQDLDGHHICALIMTFIWKLLPEYKSKLARLNTPVKMILKNKVPIKWSYDINSQLVPRKGEEFKYLKGLGSLTKEMMKEVIRVDTLEKMIVDFDYDDLEILSDFMGADSKPRKEYILNHDFNIASA